MQQHAGKYFAHGSEAHFEHAETLSGCFGN